MKLFMFCEKLDANEPLDTGDRTADVERSTAGADHATVPYTVKMAIPLPGSRPS